MRLLLFLFILATVMLAQEPAKKSANRGLVSACGDRKHIGGVEIPRMGTSPTRAVNADGIISCMSATPSPGSCHVLRASNGSQMDLSPNDTLGVGPQQDTFTFTCGWEATKCNLQYCD